MEAYRLSHKQDESDPSIRADLKPAIDQAPEDQEAWQASAKNRLHATFQVSRQETRMIYPQDRQHGMRIARILVLSLILTGSGRMLDAAETPQQEGGYYTAKVSETYPGAVALTSGQNAPGLKRMLLRALSGNPNVNPGFVHGDSDLDRVEAWDPGRPLPRSVAAAREVAAQMIPLQRSLHVASGPDGTEAGAKVVGIDGVEASVQVWERVLEIYLERIINEGVMAASSMRTTLTLEGGEEIEVRYGSAMVSRFALPAERLERLESGREAGEIMTERYLYRVVPEVKLIARADASPHDDALAPATTDGPSAGLAYLISYLNAHTEGGLLDGAVVAASGTLAEDGTVGPVGGFPAKEMAAAHAGASILIVPEGTMRAFRPARGMEVLEVSSARQAIDHLCVRTAAAETAASPLCAEAEGPLDLRRKSRTVPVTFLERPRDAHDRP